MTPKQHLREFQLRDSRIVAYATQLLSLRQRAGLPRNYGEMVAIIGDHQQNLSASTIHDVLRHAGISTDNF